LSRRGKVSGSLPDWALLANLWDFVVEDTHGVNGAKNDIGDTISCLIATIPSMNHGFGAVNPWHRNWCSTLDDNDTVGIGLQNSADEFISIWW
jgi:hypothetical protein